MTAKKMTIYIAHKCFWQFLQVNILVFAMCNGTKLIPELVRMQAADYLFNEGLWATVRRSVIILDDTDFRSLRKL